MKKVLSYGVLGGSEFFFISLLLFITSPCTTLQIPMNVIFQKKCLDLIGQSSM